MKNLPLAKDIAAIIPQYAGNEDRTVILTNAGERFSYTSRMRTILKHIAYGLCLDLYAIKKHTAKATQQAILQPLPLSPALLLIPLKVRRPCTLGQPTIGYVNFYSIKNILDKAAGHTPSYRSSIELCGGNTLPIIWTCSTVKKQLRNAKLSADEISISPLGAKQPENAALLLLAQRIMDFLNDALHLKR